MSATRPTSFGSFGCIGCSCVGDGDGRFEIEAPIVADASAARARLLNVFASRTHASAACGRQPPRSSRTPAYSSPARRQGRARRDHPRRSDRAGAPASSGSSPPFPFRWSASEMIFSALFGSGKIAAQRRRPARPRTASARTPRACAGLPSHDTIAPRMGRMTRAKMVGCASIQSRDDVDVVHGGFLQGLRCK